MSDIFDYINWRGDLSLLQTPFNELDGVILARLSYLPYEQVLQEHETVTLRQAAQALLKYAAENTGGIQQEDIRLLEALRRSDRFCKAKLKNYVNQLDLESQTQFSAITFRLDDGQNYISFRGTDDTLVGWKEDCNMSFVCPVPAQRLAVAYLERVAEQTDSALLTGGHSKGGNLAVYAAAFCSQAVQQRISAVYNYDGPGFDDPVLRAEGYQRVCERVHTFVPQSSVVGMLLGHGEKHKIVHSVQSGVMQHNVYSWEVRRDSFLCLQTVNNSSRFMKYTISAWLSELDYAQREKFFNALYEIATNSNATTLHDLSEQRLNSAKGFLKALKKLDKATRRVVIQTLKLLLLSSKSGLTQVLQKRKP